MGKLVLGAFHFLSSFQKTARGIISPTFRFFLERCGGFIKISQWRQSPLCSSQHSRIQTQNHVFPGPEGGKGGPPSGYRLQAWGGVRAGGCPEQF